MAKHGYRSKLNLRPSPKERINLQSLRSQAKLIREKYIDQRQSSNYQNVKPMNFEMKMSYRNKLSFDWKAEIERKKRKFRGRSKPKFMKSKLGLYTPQKIFSEKKFSRKIEIRPETTQKIIILKKKKTSEEKKQIGSSKQSVLLKKDTLGSTKGPNRTTKNLSSFVASQNSKEKFSSFLMKGETISKNTQKLQNTQASLPSLKVYDSFRPLSSEQSKSNFLVGFNMKVAQSASKLENENFNFDQRHNSKERRHLCYNCKCDIEKSKISRIMSQARHREKPRPKISKKEYRMLYKPRLKLKVDAPRKIPSLKKEKDPATQKMAITGWKMKDDDNFLEVDQSISEYIKHNRHEE
ncbi:unnamed protein product [Moneuplotes crassus]|uniref:Uncharacterized protein n=1 Tax=Euplotes crassus TaxID=5936 RepID=A0AAD1Y600_EUPCR|nr:unnamed protein product [Moneuplotes crassus]